MLDKLDYCANLKNIEQLSGSSNFEFIQGDIRSTDLVRFVLREENIDTVLHFAAQTHVDNSFGNSLEFTKNNIEGTHVLLEACRTSDCVKRFVHVSTDEVYGESSYELDESNTEHGSILAPTNPYSATKAGAEMLVMAYGRSYGLSYIITRGNNVYGPRQFPEKAIPKFILMLKHGLKIPIHGNGENTRSYMHAHDAAAAFDVILHHGKPMQVYNIGAHQERSVVSVARDICHLMNVDFNSNIEHVTDRAFNDRRYFIDCSKLLDLGWQQKVDWESGILDTVKWYKELPDDYWHNMATVLVPHPLAQVGAILSQITSSAPLPPQADQPIFLIYGRTGWIGGLLGEILQSENIEYHYGEARLQNTKDIERDIARYNPTHILNAAGITGRPNVDWCEVHKIEVIQTNVIGTLGMIDLAHKHNIHVTNFATGCIYSYDEEHQPNGAGFKEEDAPNFRGSFYSHTKALVESIIENYDNVLQLRLRMPISHDLLNPRNFIHKIATYEKVVDIPNSMTVLDELLPIAVQAALRNLTGKLNFTNPGVVSHNEVLKMYKEYCDNSFTWQNFSLEEQSRVLAAPRSNNKLCSEKLRHYFPDVLDIKTSLIKYVFEPSAKKGVIIPNTHRVTQ